MIGHRSAWVVRAAGCRGNGPRTAGNTLSRQIIKNKYESIMKSKRSPGWMVPMPPQRKYPFELRERETRMAIDARKDPSTRTEAYRRIGGQLGVNPEALRTWGEPGGGRRGPASRDDDGGLGPDRRTRARGPRAAPGEPDPEAGLGLSIAPEPDWPSRGCARPERDPQGAGLPGHPGCAVRRRAAHASEGNRLWVADMTYVRTFARWFMRRSSSI